ncbi:hypothetical protein [Dyadobacter aurulentus]|uniref:hypothetical protein n=1 Tax=Dyadobacter sp. UC 10 TaxID=2605428 RepID=UPI0011F14074|nr:hypothetical protein [Dyadobacter sp. UC 10]KAA0991202.1 hypothetical protein FXO21_14040 [Dyadobacter sp. UC 10]
MKKFFVLLIPAGLLFSCVKEGESKPPAPDPGAQIAGSYKVTTLEIDGKSVLLNDAGICFQLDRFSSQMVTGTMKVTLGKDREPDEILGTMHLSSTGSSGFDLYEHTRKIGSVDKARTLLISVFYKGQAIQIAARKD